MHIKSAITLIAVLLLSACTAVPPKEASDNYLSTNFKAPQAGALIVLLPPGKAGAKELEAGNTFTQQQLYTQLTQAGYRVALLNSANYEELHKQAVDAVGGIYDSSTGALRKEASAQATSSLAKRICTQLECTHVLIQRLVVRKAEVGAQRAEWDGQSRSIEKFNTGGNMTHFKGSTTGMSLELTALTANGEVAFKRYGGISLPHEFDLIKNESKLRRDIFRNDEEVSDGVRIAIRPFLKPQLDTQPIKGS